MSLRVEFHLAVHWITQRFHAPYSPSTADGPPAGSSSLPNMARTMIVCLEWLRRQGGMSPRRLSENYGFKKIFSEKFRNITLLLAHL